MKILHTWTGKYLEETDYHYKQKNEIVKVLKTVILESALDTFLSNR